MKPVPTGLDNPSRIETAKLHYAWFVAAVTFLVLLASAGVRATPSVLFVPLEHEFGWSRALISAAVSVNIALFGLVGPFAASFLSRSGLRRVVTTALIVIALASSLSALMREPWQLFLLWGLLVGVGTGATSMVLAAVVTNRWFERHRGLVLGLLTAANATGQLVFLPLIASLAEHRNWRISVLAVGSVAGGVALLAGLVLRNRPEDVGLQAFGATQPHRPSIAMQPVSALGMAIRHREFWLLAATFFVCGASTNGLVGTHLIPACMDHGIPEVRAAGLLAVMGIFDLLGTTASGWLTDRFDSRTLLFAYYSLRGLALLYLPHSLASSAQSLSLFAVFYGLDWIATVPPTVRLVTDAFGRENAGVVYGWIGAAHQIGASLAALLAGVIRTSTGDYRIAFQGAGVLCVAAGALLVAEKLRVVRSAAEVPETV